MKVEYKYFIILMTLASIVSILVLHNAHKENNNYTLETNKLNNQYINVNDFGIYLQNEKDRTQYDKQPNNDYPTKGYVLNTSRTKCYDYHGTEVKDKVSQTDEGRIRLETTVSIYCQMYFDIDKDAPSITSMSVYGLDKENKKRTDYIYDYNINYNFSWNDTDVVYYCVKEGSTTCNESDWKKTEGKTSINGTITVTTEGTKTIYAYIRDKAKNVSSVMSKTITVDRTAPTISNLTLKGTGAQKETLQNGYTYEYTINYTAAWENDDVVSICANTNQICLEYKTTNSSKNYTGSITLPEGEESKTVYVYIKDRVGNPSIVKQETITVDRTKPTISKFTITGRDTSYALNQNVTYKIELSDNSIDKYCITTNNSSTNCDWKSGSNNSITATEPKLSTGDGKKIMYAFIKDKAGNVSNSSSNSIILDENNPTATISLVSSTSTRITVGVSGNDGTGSGIDTSKMYCRVKDGEILQAKTDGTCTVSGLNELQSYEIEAYVYDLVGRQSAVISNSYKTSMSPGTYVKSKNPAGLNVTKELGGLYRYVGGCDAKDGRCNNKVDNFICFGTETPAEDCSGNVTSEYMYRIIGIDPETGDLKLIKNTAIWEGSTNYFNWHSSSSSDITWPNSNLFKRLNGTMNGSSQGQSGNTNLFINSTTTNAKYITNDPNNTWYNMIKDTDWLYGDIGWNGSKNEADKTADEIYQIETGSKSTYTGYNKGTYTWNSTIQAKIGLMYIHDYYYSYKGDGTTNCYSSSAGCVNSWLHISKNGKSSDYQYEWTMSRWGQGSIGSYHAWYVYPAGNLYSGGLGSVLAVRPVFYLGSEKAKISSGNGTVDSPFVIVEA